MFAIVPCPFALVRKERLELSRLSAPAPKAGASTNSATFAIGFAKQTSIAQTSSPRHEAPWRQEGRALEAAYALAQKPAKSVSVAHYENFPVASLLVPGSLRGAVLAIYAFARAADDIADEGSDLPPVRLARLDAYGAMLERIERGERPDAAPFHELAAAIARHGLPLAPFRDLLSAFRQDVLKSRYANYAEVLDYCARSANPIGRLLLHLYRVQDAPSLGHADAICTGLQLTNFWQDIAVDWRKGRVYVPGEDLVRFGVSEAQIAAGRCDGDRRKP